MEIIIDAFQKYYGLDWLALVSGLSAMYLLTQKKRIGFLVNVITCICGLSVALLSSQFGFVLFNTAMMGLAVQGYFNWQKEEHIKISHPHVLSLPSKLLLLQLRPTPRLQPLCADALRNRSAQNLRI
jgi:nicotinamide riboside transporter PnuC